MSEQVFDAESRTADAIKMISNDNDSVTVVWHEIWNDLKQYCIVEQGETDDYTRDLVLCWGGWVLVKPKESVSIIYDAINGYNLSIRDDTKGNEARRLLRKGIKENSPDQAEALLGIACDMLSRELA